MRHEHKPLNRQEAKLASGKGPQQSAMDPKKDNYEDQLNGHLASKSWSFIQHMFFGMESTDRLKFYYDNKRLGFYMRYYTPSLFNEYFKKKLLPNTFVESLGEPVK